MAAGSDFSFLIIATVRLVGTNVFQLAEEIQTFIESVEEQRAVVKRMLRPLGVNEETFLELAAQSRRRSIPGKRALAKLGGDLEAIAIAEREIQATQRHIQKIE